MADQFDIATELEELFREKALNVRKPAGPPATGACNNCDAVVGEGAQFCCVECREDYAKRERAERMRAE